MISTAPPVSSPSYLPPLPRSLPGLSASSLGVISVQCVSVHLRYLYKVGTGPQHHVLEKARVVEIKLNVGGSTYLRFTLVLGNRKDKKPSWPAC